MVIGRASQGLEPAFIDRAVPLVAWGGSFHELCAKHILSTLSCRRVYIIASTSLSRDTDNLDSLVSTLQQSGINVVGTRTGFSPHTRWDQVIACSADARARDPDCIITLGAGSLTDAAKTICWMLAQPASIDSIAGLESMSEHGYPQSFNHSLNPPMVKHVAIPTTLSGGEYQNISGMSRVDQVGDKTTLRKVLFTPPTYNPQLVILDPALTITTPAQIWLSTGIRAVDHCIETLCSRLSNLAGDAAAVTGLQFLIPGLLRSKAEPDSLDARFRCMQGVIQAMSAVGSGVPLGASHAIGHQLGPLGVGHGETSCVLLPAVCKWNHKQRANVERQEQTRFVLLQLGWVQNLIAERKASPEASSTGELNTSTADLDLGDILDLIIRAIGMPRTLTDVGVGKEQLDILATNSLKDHWITTNAKPITEKAQVMEILEMVL